MDSETYSIQQIHKTPKSPGIYAWYVRIRNHTDFREYHSLFKSQVMSVEIEGNLKDKYEGKAVQKGYDFEGGIKNKEILKRAAFKFGTPIYIGISLNLERRLSEHKEMLSDHIKTGKDFDIDNDIKPDTSEESKHFAQRIAGHLNKSSTVDSNSLFIKTVEVNDDVSFSDLQEVEKFINRTFIPNFGIK